MTNTPSWLTARAGTLAACFMLTLAACTDDGGTTDEAGETGETGDPEPLAIVGDYVDDFMTEHSISEELWTFAGESYSASFSIAEYDNEQRWLVARNDDGNDFNPGLWSRFDWAWAADDLWYCQSVFDGETVDDALAGGADAEDLMMGCGGFAWTMLTPL
jgi:hypothetical protein